MDFENVNIISSGSGRRAQYMPVPTAPHSKTKRVMSNDEVLYHIKKHKGPVVLHFLLGDISIENNPVLQTNAQLASQHIYNVVQINASLCNFYACVMNGIMHVMALQVYQGTQILQVQTTQGMVAAPNPEAPISALLTKTTQPSNHARLLQYTTVDDPRGPFVDLTVRDPEYLESENCYELFISKKNNLDDPDEWFFSFANASNFYGGNGYWMKGWDPSWIATSDNFAEGTLEQILNNRLQGRKKEGQRIGIANLQPDALGIQLPQERGEPGEPEDDGELRFKGKLFKPYSKRAFDDLSDEDQELYLEVEGQWKMLHGEPDSPDYFE